MFRFSAATCKSKSFFFLSKEPFGQAPKAFITVKDTECAYYIILLLKRPHRNAKKSAHSYVQRATMRLCMSATMHRRRGPNTFHDQADLMHRKESNFRYSQGEFSNNKNQFCKILPKTLEKRGKPSVEKQRHLSGRNATLVIDAQIRHGVHFLHRGSSEPDESVSMYRKFAHESVFNGTPWKRGHIQRIYSFQKIEQFIFQAVR